MHASLDALHPAASLNPASPEHIRTMNEQAAMARDFLASSAGPAATPAMTAGPVRGERYPVPPMAAPVSYQRTREMTVDELLLENRIVFLIGEISHASAMGVVMRLLYLENQKKGVDISLYINSPGGAVDDTLAMIDTMHFIESDVSTLCIGKAMSGGAITLAAGHKGKRYCLPHSKVMIHQPYGGVYGQTTDIVIQADEIIKTKQELNELMASYTGQTVEQVTEDSERDKFFSAQEAKEYGLVDDVILPGGKKASDAEGEGEKSD
ncbi:MAG: ATP-dependent Clp protease proteolytic subunit [Planctomycetota bacterium]